MSDYVVLQQYVNDLTAEFEGKREDMRFADKFGRNLVDALNKIIEVLSNRPEEFPTCPVTKIADLKVKTEELNLDIWKFRIKVSAGISEALVLINPGPGIILFEFSREYTPRTATFSRAAVQFGQSDQPPNALQGPFPPKGPKQSWTASSLWLTDTIVTDAWVSPEKLAVQIMKHLTRFDIEADLAALINQETNAN
ncbi:MAG: hypothetical protein ABSF28_16210 [Terracidiphilus sp.]|jgi:hypothetical protein